MGVDVDVRVDEAGQERQPAQIVGRAAAAAADADDLPALDDDHGIGDRPSPSVERGGGADGDRRGLRAEGGARAEDDGDAKRDDDPDAHGGAVYSRGSSRRRRPSAFETIRRLNAEFAEHAESGYFFGAVMNARRVIADLRDLAARTSTPDGAQRLAWGPVWRDAREWFTGRVAELGLRVEADSAGNNWVTLPGRVAEDRHRRQPSRLGAERRMARRLPRA